MGSIDIPPFMKEKMKQDIQAQKSDIPPFLQKKNGGEDVTTDLQVGADGQLKQSVPTTLQSQNGEDISLYPNADPKKYETKLSNDQEIKFQKWLDSNAKNGNISKGDYDFYKKNGYGYNYDFRAAFQEGKTSSLNKTDNKQHWSDIGKKPNHPTFSTESKYNNVDGLKGGTWEGEMFSPPKLQSTLSENDYSFDPLKGIVSDKVGQPVIQQQNGNVLSINTKTIPITPYSNPISYVKDLQQRIDTGKITKQDEDFLNKNQRGNQNFDAIDDSELMSFANKYAPEIAINDNTDRLIIAKQLKDQVYDRFNKRYEGAEAVPDLDETSKKEIERLTELEKKLSFEKNKSETYPVFVEAAIRTDESGNLWNKFTNRVLSAFPTTAAAGAAGIALEAVDTKQKLPTEFSIGLNGLKYTEPIQFERVTNSLLKGEPLSESMVAQITAQGLEAKEALNKDAFVNEDIDKEQYEKQANDIQVSRYENIVNNKETLRAFISSGIANIADDVNVAKSATTDVNSFLVDKFFGHKWNYSDDEIERYGKAYAQANGIDPNDARVKEAIKYLQNNEGSMIMENSIAKTGWARDFSKGLATPIRGIASTIEDIGKTTADVYAEGQSQGNVNVSEQKIERVKNSWEGTVSDVLEGTGQFVTQAALALGVSSGIGAVGRTILGRAGVAALEGDIALADIGATNLVGKTLLGSKDALATFVTAYGQSYDSNLKQSLTYTADNNKARITANVMAGLEGATELFLSPIAVARGIGKNLFNKATTSKGIINILSDAAILDKNAAVKNFLKGTIKVVGTEISEEQVVQLADYASNAILNPNSKTFQDRDLMNEMANTAYQTGLSMAIPALVSGAGAANVNNFSKGSLIIAAQNRQQLLDDMNKRLYDGDMSQDEYNEKAAIINTASNANATLPLKENGQKLNSEEKADYIFSRVSEGILTDKVKESADEAEKVILNKKIKNEQNFRTDMLGEKEEVQQPETTTTEPIQVDEDSTLTKEEQDAIDGFNGITFTGSTKNWTDVIQSETSTPQEKKQALTELKEQLSDPNSEIATGAALGKSADLIYNLIDADKPKIESTPEESGIVVTPPESFPEPITIGEKIEPKVNEPITVSKSEVVDDVEVEKTVNGNLKLINRSSDGNVLGELKTQRNEIDKKLGTVSVTEVRANEYNRRQGVASKLYQRLLDELPKEVYGIRMSDIVMDESIHKIYKKMGAVNENGETIIKNPKYSETKPITVSEPSTEVKSEVVNKLKNEGYDIGDGIIIKNEGGNNGAATVTNFSFEKDGKKIGHLRTVDAKSFFKDEKDFPFNDADYHVVDDGIGEKGVEIYDETMRGKGIGTKMYEAAQEYLSKQNPNAGLISSSQHGQTEASYKLWKKLYKEGKAEIIYKEPESGNLKYGEDVGRDFGRGDGEANGVIYDGNVYALKSKSETKPIQNEAAKVTKDTKQAAEISEPKEVVTEATQPTKKDVGTKARELAKQYRSGEKKVLPDFLRANLPEGTKLSGIDINQAWADALDTFATVYEASKNFANAIDEAFKNIKDWFTDNNVPIDENKLKTEFSTYVKTQTPEPNVKEIADLIRKDEITYNDAIDGQDQTFVDALNTNLFGSKKFNFDTDRFKEQVRRQKSFGLTEAEVIQVFEASKKLTKVQKGLIAEVFGETAETDAIAKELQEAFKQLAKGEKPKSVLKKLSVSNVTEMVNALSDALKYTAVSNDQLDKMADFIVDAIDLNKADQFINAMISNSVADVRQLVRAKLIVALQKSGNKTLATKLVIEMADEATQSGRQTQSLKRAYEILGAQGNPATRTEFARRMAEVVQEKARKMTERYGDVISEQKAEIGRLNERLHQKTQTSPLINKIKDVIATLCGLRNKAK